MKNQTFVRVKDGDALEHLERSLDPKDGCRDAQREWARDGPEHRGPCRLDQMPRLPARNRIPEGVHMDPGGGVRVHPFVHIETMRSTANAEKGRRNPTPGG